MYASNVGWPAPTYMFADWSPVSKRMWEKICESEVKMSLGEQNYGSCPN